jgi:hypothetical protein
VSVLSSFFTVTTSEIGMPRRISPRASASPEPEKRLPSVAPPDNQPDSTKEPEMELPPVEDILAKYTGIASVTASVSSGPGPSSAAQSPVPDSFLSVSNLAPQSKNAGVNGREATTASKSSEFCPTLTQFRL